VNFGRVLLWVIACALGGCSAAGAIMHKVAGPPAVPAKFVPAPKPLLVLVENYSRQSSGHADEDLLARYVEGELKEHKVAPVVDSTKLRELRMARPGDFHELSISNLGRKVGAEQVLYVNIVESRIEPLLGDESVRTQTSVRVKMIDVSNGETRWPTDMEAGFPLEYKSEWGTGIGRSEMEIKQGIYRALSDRIAKLFYKWKPDQEEPEGFIGQ